MWKKLAGFLKSYWKLVILIPICIGMEVWCYVQLPNLLSRIINEGIVPLNMDVVWSLGWQMLGYAFLEVIFSFLGLYLAARATINTTTDLRQAIFNKIQTFSFADLDHFGIGSLITRLTNDISQVQMMLTMLLRMALRAPLMIVASAFMLLKINSTLSLILVVGLVVLAVTVILIMRKALPLFLKSQQKLDDLNSTTEENLNAIKTIKVFVREKFAMANFDKVNEELTNILLKVAVLMTVIFPIIMLVLNLSTVAVIWFGSGAIQVGNMAVGDLVAFINYTNQILFSFVMVSMIFMMILRAQASMKRIGEVMNHRSQITNPRHPTDHVIASGKVEFKNVSFSFTGKKKGEENLVLKNISFTINSGQKLGIIGGTGSGKSVLISLILRLYDVTSGSILVDGVDVRDYKLNELRQSIGVVLQDSTLFSGSIKNNLRWGDADAPNTEMDKFLNIAQAYDFVYKKPQGLDYELSRQATNLSGGQKQRLSIARALIKKSKILILDDATSAVDMQTEKQIQEEIKATGEEMTMIVVGQRISSVMDSDLILVLRDGEIVCQGQHDELLKSSVIYKEIYDTQLGKQSK